MSEIEVIIQETLVACFAHDALGQSDIKRNAQSIIAALNDANFAITPIDGESVRVPREPTDAELEQASLLFQKAWWGADNNSRRDAWNALINALAAAQE